MKGPLVCFALVLTAGLLLSQEVEPEKTNADPGRKRADLSGGLCPTRTPGRITLLDGGGPDTHEHVSTWAWFKSG
jgi:hypothetical protein